MTILFNADFVKCFIVIPLLFLSKSPSALYNDKIYKKNLGKIFP